MQTLTLAATKGGVSKTTLAAALAVYASIRGERVAVVDLDPQRSLSRWHEARVRDRGEAGKPALIPAGKKRLDEIKAAGAALDWLIFDTPPGAAQITGRAVAAADLVIVPIRPSPLDVEAIRAMVAQCHTVGREFLFVLTQTAPAKAGKEMVDGARAYLQKLGTVTETEIANRVIYSSAMLSGGVAIETEAAARTEIGALWNEITKRVAGARRGKKVV
jgi:chromosome partitioning protein